MKIKKASILKSSVFENKSVLEVALEFEEISIRKLESDEKNLLH